MDEILRKLEDVERRLSALERGPRQPAYMERLEAAPAPPVIREIPRPPAEPQPHRGFLRLPQEEKKNIESFIGRWWLGIAGVVAVLFGASFFLKYAFEQNLIGPTGRVVIEMLAGLLCIVAGEWIRRWQPKYSYIISGGGLGLLYLATYGAFQWYALIGQGTAFGFMAAITAFGIALSLYDDAIELAGIATFGGFLTPFLLSTGTPQDYNFFGYLIVLNLGVLGVAFFKKWRKLTLLGFVATILCFVMWYGSAYTDAKLFFTLTILAVFYAIYLVTGLAAPFASEEQADSGDLFILTINPAWFFGWLYYLLQPRYATSLGFLAALLGALYVFCAYAGLQMRKKDTRYVFFLSGLAVIFLTIAVPLQLDQNAITIAWAIEAAILFVLGLKLEMKGMRTGAFLIFTLALFRLIFFDSGAGDIAQFIPLFNKRFFTYLVVAAVAGAITYASVLWRDRTRPAEHEISMIAGLILSALILTACTLDISSFFNYKIYRENILTNQGQLQAEIPYTIYGGVPANTALQSFINQRNAAISVFWTIYAIIMISIGMSWHKAGIRWAALALFGLTALKVFLIDLANLPTPYRIISFMVLGVLLLAASYLYFRFEKKLSAADAGERQS